MIPSVSIDDGSLAEIIDQNCHKFPQDPEKKIHCIFRKKIFKTWRKDEMYIFRGL